MRISFLLMSKVYDRLKGGKKKAAEKICRLFEGVLLSSSASAAFGTCSVTSARS